MAPSEPSPERTPFEIELRSRADAGEHETVVTLAIERYGAEILGYMHALLGAPSDADEAFSEVCERFWRSRESFRWQCSCRTWMYAIARNVGRSRIQSRARVRAREVPLSQAPEVARLAEQVRSSTALHLKTESRTRLEQIRAALDPDDRTLLVLRVDRKLPWTEIAVVLCDTDTIEGPALTREAARLRKRFERLRARVIKSMREQTSTASSDAPVD